MKKKWYKPISLVLTVILLLSAVLPIAANAAEVTMDISKCTVSQDHTLTDEEGKPFTGAYGLRKADNPFGYAISEKVRTMHDYTAKRPGLTGSNSDWVVGQDYVYCFCIEHGVPLPDNTEYAGSSNETYGNKYKMLSVAQRELLHLALSYGYPNRTDVNTAKDANACYAATQLIVWQITLGFRPSPTELNDKTYPIAGYTGTMTEQYCSNKYLKSYYDRILADMAAFHTRPSFATEFVYAAKTYEMLYVGGKYTVILTDTNNVLKDFTVSTSGGLTTKITGNMLTITSAKPITGDITLKLNRKMPQTNHTTGFLIWSVPGKENANQDMVSGTKGNVDPVPSYFKLSTPTGGLKLIKTSEDGKVSGISFTIKGDGVNTTRITDANGEIDISDLDPGTYTAAENNSVLYEPQGTQTFTIKPNQTTTIYFDNKLKRGSLEVTKTAEDGLVEGKEFHLFGTSDAGIAVDSYAVTDSSGVARFENILKTENSTLTLEETDTGIQYVVPGTQQVKIEWNKVTQAAVHNVLKKWRLTVTKLDSETGGTPQGNAELAGAVYGIYKGDELVQTYTTDEIGSFTTEYYICADDWTMKEITPSPGYQLDETVYSIGASAEEFTIEYNPLSMEVTEEVIRGAVTVKKADSLDNDILLSGAEFEVYADMDGDKEFDAETDILVDTLKETENGFYELTELLPGGYFLHEAKQPNEAYLPDDGYYYFEITEHGQTVAISNAENGLFVNAPILGGIEIIKCDADTGERLANVGFRIRNVGGEVVREAYTDENGFVGFYDLRMGQYTYQEISVNGNYIIDSTEYPFEITEDKQIIKIDMTNTKIPQTGDMGYTVTYMPLLFLVPLAALGTCIVAVKPRKKSKSK